MTAHTCCNVSSTRQKSSALVIISPALKPKASTPEVASTLMTWLLEITPTAIPSLSHTTTRGVSRFARIWAASKSDASGLSTASRFRAESKMFLTRIISIVPHLSFVRGSPPRSDAAERGRYADEDPLTFLDQVGGSLEESAAGRGVSSYRPTRFEAPSTARNQLVRLYGPSRAPDICWEPSLHRIRT